MLYMNFAQFDPNPRIALRAVQASLVDSYSINDLIQERIAETLEVMGSAWEDPADSWLLRLREELESLEVLAKRPMPTTPLSKIEFVQDAYRYDMVGFGNLLDIRDVSESQRPYAAAPLKPPVMWRALGHNRPTQSEARTLAFAVKPNLRPAECIYFPVYRDQNPSPDELCFVGKSVD